MSVMLDVQEVFMVWFGLVFSQKEAVHVTFQAEPEEYTVPMSSWSMRPFLGYDWIAGEP